MRRASSAAYKYAATMIKVDFDETKLSTEDRAFLQAWADSLNITVSELLGRMLIAAVEGEHYIENMPDEFQEQSVGVGRCDADMASYFGI